MNNKGDVYDPSKWSLSKILKPIDCGAKTTKNHQMRIIFFSGTFVR